MLEFEDVAREEYDEEKVKSVQGSLFPVFVAQLRGDRAKLWTETGLHPLVHDRK